MEGLRKKIERTKKLKKYLGLRDGSVVATVYGTEANALEYGSIYSWGLFKNVWFWIPLARHGKRQQQKNYTSKVCAKINLPEKVRKL